MTDEQTYIVIRQVNINDLMEYVEIYINKGWEPIGGISLDTKGNIAQAMINRPKMNNKINIAQNQNVDFVRIDTR